VDIRTSFLSKLTYSYSNSGTTLIPLSSCLLADYKKNSKSVVEQLTTFFSKSGYSPNAEEIKSLKKQIESSKMDVKDKNNKIYEFNKTINNLQELQSNQEQELKALKIQVDNLQQANQSLRSKSAEQQQSHQSLSTLHQLIMHLEEGQ